MSGLFAWLVIGLLTVQLPPGTGVIRGVVIKAGTRIEQPLRNARLELTGGRGGPLIARTDASGRFAFTGLAPGQYRLAITADGFIRQESSRIVLGAGQQVADIVFELDLAPTATGWILDRYGEPISNVVVEALRRSYDVRGKPRFARVATGVTDDRGEYRIFWLDPGEYFFYVSSPPPDPVTGKPARAVEPTHFPGVNTAEDAKSVRLDIGREVRIDFRLRPVGLWPVNGQVMHAVTGRALGAAVTLTPPAGDPSLSRYRGQSSLVGRLAGYFSINNVAPGAYIVMARSGSGNQEMTAVQRIDLRPSMIAPPGGFTMNLNLAPPLSIGLQLFVDSRATVDLRHTQVALTSVDPDLPSPQSVELQADRPFAVHGVIPGSYVLDVANLPDDFYLKAARYGADDILEKPLTIAPRDSGKPLQILLGSDGARLEVAAYNAKGEPQPGAQLVLAPDAARRLRREQYRVAAADEDGRAMLRGIPPGTYKLFAWEYLEPNAYLNSDYMRAYEDLGQRVNIENGDNPPVSVRVIPKD